MLSFRAFGRPGGAFALVACVSGIVASCSAGVDGFHLGTSEAGLNEKDGGNQATGGSDHGDGSSSGGNPGASGATTTGGRPPNLIHPDAGRDVNVSSGGAPFDASLDGNGGTGTLFDSGAGGAGTGGAPNTGGKPATGGAPATGGVTGTGGATATYPTDPTAVTLSVTTLTGIKTAAWEASSKRFFLFEPVNHRFWQLNPATGQVDTNSYPIPAGTVASDAFGVSATSVFVIVNNAIYTLQHTGGTSGPSVALSGSHNAGDLHGAHAGSYFFVGDSGAGGAQSLADGAGAVTTYPSLTAVGAITTDGTSFAFHQTVATYAYANLVTPGSFAANSPACRAGNASDVTIPLGVSGNRVAWVAGSGTSYLYDATVSGGTCTTGSFVSIGQTALASKVAGLFDDSYGLVIPSFVSPVASVKIVQVTGSYVSAELGSLGVGNAINAIVVASGAQPHHAVIVGDRPVLIHF